MDKRLRDTLMRELFPFILSFYQEKWIKKNVFATPLGGELPNLMIKYFMWNISANSSFEIRSKP